MVDGQYKVSLEGEGLTLTRNVSKEVGEQILLLVVTGNVGTAKVSVPVAPAAPAAPTAENVVASAPIKTAVVEGDGLAEFLASHSAKRNPDKIAALAYWLKTERGRASFTKDDLPKLFEAAGERPPANLSRDFTLTKEAGWIHPLVNDPDSYQLTNKGRTAVTSNFSTGLSFRNRRKGRKGKDEEAEVAETLPLGQAEE